MKYVYKYFKEIDLNVATKTSVLQVEISLKLKFKAKLLCAS